MKIGITSDHRGIILKEKIINYLKELGYETKDYGTNSNTSVDYPEYAFKLGEEIISKKIDLGIAICGTGIGMSIALNKVKGIMCAKIDNVNDAIHAKKHNNANALAISANNSIFKTKKMLKAFLSSNPEEDEKYQRRINQIKDYEEK